MLHFLRVLRIDITRGRRRGRPAKYGPPKISLVKAHGQVRVWQTVECKVYGETVTKLYTTFLATYAPVGSMIRVVPVDEVYRSIGEGQHGFSESADGWFL